MNRREFHSLKILIGFPRQCPRTKLIVFLPKFKAVEYVTDIRPNIRVRRRYSGEIYNSDKENNDNGDSDNKNTVLSFHKDYFTTTLKTLESL